MRTTFAAAPRPFALQPSFQIKAYTAQPFPPIAWKQVPSSNAVKWCEAVHLTWTVSTENSDKEA